MTDNNGKIPKDERNLTIEINRNEDRGYTIFSVRDDDRHKLMADVVIPDETLIDETYRLGGGVPPYIVMGEIVGLVLDALEASFQKIGESGEMGESEESEDEPPEAK